MPAAVAARPRDPRGYPIPAITPWADGEPRFAATGIARTYLCAVERRCSICALTMPDGPVWRVVGGEEADAIAHALGKGIPYRNNVATSEAPGHRACMMYAACVCPWLARPTARRADPALKGQRRPPGGAVVSFDAYEFRYQTEVLFRFAGVGEVWPYGQGEDLRRLLTPEPEPPHESAPAYLLADEVAAQQRFAVYLRRAS